MNSPAVDLDLDTKPWPQVSAPAKDLIRRMLQVLCSPPATAPQPLNEFALFCKENFGSVRKTLPARTPNATIFKHMGQL